MMMDPNKALADLRQAYSDWEDLRGGDGVNNLRATDAADRMRDAAWALDEWLKAGGFLPAAWERKHTTALAALVAEWQAATRRLLSQPVSPAHVANMVNGIAAELTMLRDRR